MSKREDQYLGYDHEANYGVSVIDDAGDAAFWLGVTPRVLELPYPKNVLFDPEPPAGSALSTSGAFAKTTIPEGQIPIAPVDGVPFMLSMGASSTGAGPPFTHTITFGAPGHTPKSISLYHEVSGTGGTLLSWLLKGMVVTDASLEIGVFDGEDILTMVLGYMGQQAVAAGFTLNTPPARRIAGSRPFTWGDLTNGSGAYTYDGNPLTGLQRIGIRWETSYRVLLAHRADGGVNLSHRPYTAISLRAKRPLITLEGEFGDDTFLDDLIATSNTKDLVLKWHRGANDTLQIDALNCWPVEGPVSIGTPDDPARQRVILAPMGGYTVTVIDSLAGASYGE